MLSMGMISHPVRYMHGALDDDSSTLDGDVAN